MAKKKKKSVLDYDPLAWLNESHGEQPSLGLDAQSSLEESKKQPEQQNVQMQQDTETAQEQEAQGFGFFTDTPSESETNNIDEAEQGFGFFAVNNKPTAENDEAESNDKGYGFFAQDNTQEQEVETNSSDEGFGFFADDAGKDSPEQKEIKQVSKENVLNLGSELTIRTVSEMKQQIDSKLSDDEEIVLDAEEMIKIDMAGLQMLYSLKHCLEKTGHHIKWVGTSTVINDSAEMIGMPLLAPKSKDACFGFFEENIVTKDAEDGSSGFF